MAAAAAKAKPKPKVAKAPEDAASASEVCIVSVYISVSHCRRWRYPRVALEWATCGDFLGRTCPSVPIFKDRLCFDISFQRCLYSGVDLYVCLMAVAVQSGMRGRGAGAGRAVARWKPCCRFLQRPVPVMDASHWNTAITPKTAYVGSCYFLWFVARPFIGKVFVKHDAQPNDVSQRLRS